MSTRGTGLTAAALPHRSRDYAAALATAACLAELLLAPLTLLLSALLAVTARLTRWRLHWLALPAAAGLLLILTRGSAAATGYLAWPRWLIGGLSGPGPHGRLLAAAARDLPGQLPIALIAGSAQAAGLGALTSRAPRRPGLIATVRGRHCAALLAAGRTVTADGCALGFDPATGRRAGLSWAEAGLGVLVRAASPAAAAGPCLPILCAALRRRKSVIVADLSAGEAVRPVRALAAFTGQYVADLAVPELAGTGPRPWPAVFGPALRQRTVIAGRAEPGAVAGLTAVLTSLAGLGLRADALAWIHGCERASPAALRALLSAGREAGCAMLLSTADPAAADALASAAGVTLTVAPVPGGPVRGGPVRGGPVRGGPVRGGPVRGGPVPAGEFAGQPAGTFAIRAGARQEAGLVAVPLRPAGTS